MHEHPPCSTLHANRTRRRTATLPANSTPTCHISCSLPPIHSDRAKIFSDVLHLSRTSWWTSGKMKAWMAS